MYFPLIFKSAHRLIGFFIHNHAHLALVGPPHGALPHPLAPHALLSPAVLPTHVHISCVLLASPPCPHTAPLSSTLASV